MDVFLISLYVNIQNLNRQSFRWIFLVIAIILVLPAIVDMYNWVIISSNSSKSMSQVLDEYYSTFPDIFKGFSRLNTMYIIRVSNILFLSIAILLFIFSKAIFKKRWPILIINGIMILSIVLICLQLFMLA